MSVDRHADVAIFGSGFAAFEIARTAVGRGQSVIVIERGSDDPATADPALSVVPFRREPIVSGGLDFGAQVPEGFASVPRYVGLGGTSELWSGKWRRLDRVDMCRARGGRGWPVSRDELTPHYDAIAAGYGWPDWSAGATADDHRTAFQQHDLRTVEIYEEAPPLRLRPKWAALAQEPSVEIICGATLSDAVTDAQGCYLEQVRLRHADASRSVSATNFVIACGGIESVHVCDRLTAVTSVGAPTSRPRTYAGFMDHPKAFVGEVMPRRHKSLVEYLQTERATRKRLLALALPDDELLESGLGNHTIFLWPMGKPAAAHPLRIVINLEQFPEDENLVVPGPSPSVSWRVSRRTWTDFEAFMAVFAPRLTALLGPLRRLDTLAFRGASHHSGALPMGTSDTHPVDAHCRVRNFTNVYCVSSALFPFAGSANPTMTVLALARRLMHDRQALGSP